MHFIGMDGHITTLDFTVGNEVGRLVSVSILCRRLISKELWSRATLGISVDLYNYSTATRYEG